MRKVLLMALLAGTAFGQASGTWKMNPFKSDRDKGPQTKAVVFELEPHPDGEAVTIWRVTLVGSFETDSYIVRYDGQDRPYPRPERFHSFNAKKLANGACEILFKKEGKVVGCMVWCLNADTQQMAIQSQSLSRTRQWTNCVLVLEKQMKGETYENER